MQIASNNLISRKVDDEVLIVNAAMGTCYTLNKVAADIWSMISDNKEIDEITSDISNKYGKDPQVVKQDVEELIHELKTEGLLFNKN